jgi:hypothetical protein
MPARHSNHTHITPTKPTVVANAFRHTETTVPMLVLKVLRKPSLLPDKHSKQTFTKVSVEQSQNIAL